jgi:hypothetical protein
MPYEGSNIQKKIRSVLKEQLRECVAKMQDEARPSYEPTGLQEDIICAVGCGKYKIVVALDANRTGKTGTIMNIAKNIFWPYDKEWFGWWEGDNVFAKWPFSEKVFRITGTPTAVADNGPMMIEMRKWWPREKYTLDKGGKNYYSQITTDTGWCGDVMTYEQSREEYEGKTLSLVISDEPPKASLIGPITSRLMQGIWIIGATPINCGIFLDILDDLEEKGSKIKRISGTIWQNDKDTGKLNHKGTKRGLWSKQEIDEYVATIPIDERDSRLEGKVSNKSGKIYPMYDSMIHLRKIDLAGGYLSKCNCYMAIDPSPKYYPFIKWYAITPENEVFVYNEWPTRKGMGGLYFDEIRHSRQFKLSMEQLAAIIKACDLVQCGANVLGRIIDPRFAAQFPEYMVELGRWGISGWRIPPADRIETQRIRLQQMMTWDEQLPFNEHNKPKWYCTPWCENSDRAYNRHYWIEKKPGTANADGIEGEDYKDSIDCDRYFLGAIDIKWSDTIVQNSVKKRPQVNLLQKSYADRLAVASMVE